MCSSRLRTRRSQKSAIYDVSLRRATDAVQGEGWFHLCKQKMQANHKIIIVGSVQLRNREADVRNKSVPGDHHIAALN